MTKTEGAEGEKQNLELDIVWGLRCEQIGQTNIQSGEGTGDSGYYDLPSPWTLDMCHLNKLSMMTVCFPRLYLTIADNMDGGLRRRARDVEPGPVGLVTQVQLAHHHHHWARVTCHAMSRHVMAEVSQQGEEACPHQALVCHNVVISASLSARRHTMFTFVLCSF